MKYQLSICALLTVAIAVPAQMSSHAPTQVASAPAAVTTTAPQAREQTVAVVNGAVLTDRDLLREMYTIFPYAQQHNGGFPKAQEASIRQGALQMIIFEELVYQEAVRRKLTVSPEKMTAAESAFRKQFKSPDEYQEYLQLEVHGSNAELRTKIRRSLLIDRLLKMEVEDKATVSAAELTAFYQKNPGRFEKPETFDFQSISVIPPFKPTAQQAKDAREKAENALEQAKAAKSDQEFGLLAEKISEDDFRVNMGEHKAAGRDKLPPQVLSALLAMSPGQVSGLIPIESAYTIVRLDAHNRVHKKSLDEVRAELKVELQKEKYEKLRTTLDKTLRAKAKIQVS